jgi:hypothetical protein
LNECCEFPGKVGGIVNPGIHAKTALWRKKVDSIPCHDDTSASVGISDQSLAGSPGKMA